MDVIVDLADDIAVQQAVRRRCRPGSGRLAVDPAPGTGEWNGVVLPVYLALGEPPRHLMEWPPAPRQLTLLSDEDLCEHPATAAGVQLPLLPDYEQVLARRRIFHTSPALTPSEMRFHLQNARIRELHVVGAQAIRPAAWGLLRRLTDDGIRLCLVVAGCRPTAAQLAALRPGRVRCRELRRRRDLVPWERARSRSRAHPASPSPVLPEPPPSEVPFAAFQRAAAALMADAPVRSFLTVAPRPLVIPPERLAAAFRRCIERWSESALDVSG